MPDHKIVRRVGKLPNDLVWEVKEWIETTTRPDENKAAIELIREYTKVVLAHGAPPFPVMGGLWECLCETIGVEVGS